jgi:predicted nucleic acid-binding protein
LIAVLDASAIGSILLPEEEKHVLSGLPAILAGEGVAVPAHWPIEVVNLILTARRHERLTDAGAQQAFRTIGAIVVEIDPSSIEGLTGGTWALAKRHRLTVYDAAYLELAARLRLPLASNDKALLRAAASENVELFGR